MALLQCKMCGGNLVLSDKGSVTTCDSCGLQQTLPSAGDEKRLNLYEQANNYRRNKAFDLAASTYSAIVAEWPEEAEAYWGLVLCKYGIEYVTDPKSGKPVPTCNRSSYDSVLENENLEKACKFADFYTRRKYMDDAEQLENIRQGIVAVSAKEDPYDIFICYKETDEFGNRTEDSLLAQNLYQALTDANYRVFFSRVTLKGQLGAAFEPRIFAALHSAKVMLVVTTKREHLEATWVKNEWSRYLALMDQDRSKHLYPCYKGIKPEELGETFKSLQGQDLGQIGAEQDVLLCIEKVLPRKKKTEEQPKQVVIRQDGASFESLLDRGQMALEDGDWNEADKFFEKVLNGDSKNAPAYLGKFLAREKATSLERLVQNRIRNNDYVACQRPTIATDREAVERIISECLIPDYVAKSDLKMVFAFSPEYDDAVSGRSQQLQEEQMFWEQDRLLIRALQFGDQEMVRSIQNAKETAIEQARKRLAQAEEDVAANKQAREAAYAAHMQSATEKAKQIYQAGLARRDNDYQALERRVHQASVTKNKAEVESLIPELERLAYYRDAKSLIATCQKTLAQIEKDRIRKEKSDIAKGKANGCLKSIGKFFLKVGIVVGLILLLVAYCTQIRPNGKYKDAKELMDNGQYVEAAEAFIDLGDHKDSKDMACLCIEKMIEIGALERPLELLQMLSGYEKADALIYKCAEKYLETGDTYMAATTFAKATGNPEAFSRSKELWLTMTNRNYSDVAPIGGHFVAITQEGKVRVSDGWLSDAYGEEAVLGEPLSKFADAEAVAFRGSEDLVVLLADGTVQVECIHGEDCSHKTEAAKWRKVIDIDAGKDGIIGLCMDGTVVSTGSRSYDTEEMGKLVDVVAGDGSSYVGGIRADGTVWTYGTANNVTKEIKDWRNIVMLDLGSYQVVGLKKDGTVVVSTSYGEDQLAATEWVDITYVSCGSDYVLGIDKQGNVHTTAENAAPVEGTGFVTLEAAEQNYAGNCIYVKNDGTLYAFGEYFNEEGYPVTLAPWENIKYQELDDFAETETPEETNPQ